MKKIIVLMAAVCMTAINSFSQNMKLAHINGQKLVEHMVEYKTAYDELNAYKTQFEDALRAMEQEYQTLIDEFEKNQNIWPKPVLDSKVKAIEQKRQQIYEFQETASADVSQKELEKLDPILKKAKQAIEDVAKENGYTYVFDVSTAVLLYLGGDDLTAKVCAKLGIPDFTSEMITPAPQNQPAPANQPGPANNPPAPPKK